MKSSKKFKTHRRIDQWLKEGLNTESGATNSPPIAYCKISRSSQTPFSLLWHHCPHQWKDDPFKIMSVFVATDNAPTTTEQCLSPHRQPGDKPGRIHVPLVALRFTTQHSPPPQKKTTKPHPTLKCHPPKQTYTPKSTKGTNLLLEARGLRWPGSSFPLFSHRPGWIHAACLQTVVRDATSPAIIFNLPESITTAISTPLSNRSACARFRATDFISSLAVKYFY